MEKLLKAVLVLEGVAIRRTHDIDGLCAEVQELGIILCRCPDALAVLSSYPVRRRVPLHSRQHGGGWPRPYRGLPARSCVADMGGGADHRRRPGRRIRPIRPGFRSGEGSLKSVAAGASASQWPWAPISAVWWIAGPVANAPYSPRVNHLTRTKRLFSGGQAPHSLDGRTYRSEMPAPRIPRVAPVRHRRMSRTPPPIRTRPGRFPTSADGRHLVAGAHPRAATACTAPGPVAMSRRLCREDAPRCSPG